MWACHDGFVPIVVDEEMQTNLYRDGRGVQYLCSRIAGEETIKVFEHLQTRYREAVVDLRVGSTNSMTKLNVAVFLRPRANGCRIYANLFAIYGVLGLKVAKARPSKWVYDRHASWELRIQKTLGRGHICHSNQSEDTSLVWQD